MRALDLVEHDELVGRRATLTAVLHRPAEPQPTVGAHDVHEAPELGTACAGNSQPRTDFGSEHLREVGAQPTAQRLLIGGLGEMHDQMLRGF